MFGMKFVKIRMYHCISDYERFSVIEFLLCVNLMFRNLELFLQGLYLQTCFMQNRYRKPWLKLIIKKIL